MPTRRPRRRARIVARPPLHTIAGAPRLFRHCRLDSPRLALLLPLPAPARPVWPWQLS